VTCKLAAVTRTADFACVRSVTLADSQHAACGAVINCVISDRTTVVVERELLGNLEALQTSLAPCARTGGGTCSVSFQFRYFVFVPIMFASVSTFFRFRLDFCPFGPSLSSLRSLSVFKSSRA